MTHTNRSSGRRMPGRGAHCRGGTCPRTSGGRARTRDYRHGPPHVRGELGVARDAIDGLDRTASAMGGPARRLHGVSWRRSDRVRAERLGHRHARVGVVAAAAGGSRSWPPFAPTAICTVALAAGLSTRCSAHTRSSALGGAIKPSRESLDRRTHQAPGQLVDVGGHRLHLLCVGSGTPTVILESGLG